LSSKPLEAHVVCAALEVTQAPASVDAAALRLLEVVSCRQHMPALMAVVENHGAATALSVSEEPPTTFGARAFGRALDDRPQTPTLELQLIQGASLEKFSLGAPSWV